MGVRQVHDPVVHEGRRLLRTRLVHGPRPHELKLAHIGPVDLIERAVPPRIVGAPPVEPVSWSGVAQRLLGDRTKVGRLGHEAGAPKQHYEGSGDKGSDYNRLLLLVSLGTFLIIMDLRGVVPDRRSRSAP